MTAGLTRVAIAKASDGTSSLVAAAGSPLHFQREPIHIGCYARVDSVILLNRPHAVAAFLKGGDALHGGFHLTGPRHGGPTP